MRKFPIRLLMLAICATSLVAVPTVTPVQAAPNNSTHVKKKRVHVNPGIGDSRFSNQKSSNQAQPSNPYDDPDRKVSY